MVTPRKPKKVAGKKAVPKRAVVKKTTARKGKAKVNKHKANQDRLKKDINFYNAQGGSIETLRRTRPTKKHPNGVTYASLDFDEQNNAYYSSMDRDIKVSISEYNRGGAYQLSANPFAVPIYTPLHKDGKIVAYRNTTTGDLVTPYYRNNIFRKYFKPKAYSENADKAYTKDQTIRIAAYEASLNRQRYARTARTVDLVGSYQILHPDMNRQQIRSEPTFQNLVAQLQVFHTGGYKVSAQNKAMLDRIYGEDTNFEEAGLIEVLVLLGRRLPTDTNALGESDPNHIKNTVRPFYEGATNTVPFESEEE